MMRYSSGLMVAALLIAAIARPLAAADDLAAEDVKRAIDEGVRFLKTQQNVQGDWRDYAGYRGGITALCTLALLNCGVDKDDPAVQRALQRLEALGNPQMTYSTALQTMVFAEADPEKYSLQISANAKWLESMQVRDNARGMRGGWGYAQNLGTGDNSNSQFALLALHEAERVGVRVSDQTWRLAQEHWMEMQNTDGSWAYQPGKDPTGSMTCAGIASLIICSGKLSGGASSVNNGRVRCCGSGDNDQVAERIELGLDWLGRKFTVNNNPSVRFRGGDSDWLYYYMYGVERVGRLTGRRFFFSRDGSHDWYRAGAAALVKNQEPTGGFWRGSFAAETNPLISTSLALLFLSKGQRPVVIAKLKHSEAQFRAARNDWDLHAGGVQNLTRAVELRWQRNLTWQTIDSRAASTPDLLEAPVLFISGSDSLDFSQAEKNNLVEYVQQGGFIFAEACDGNGCDGAEFDRKFRALMQELFPESQLRLLPADHPIWFAQEKVDPQYARPLYGIDACCRTSIVYCPRALSCFWELSQQDRESRYPQEVQDEIAACISMGVNVLAYATNRELKEKLDRPAYVAADQQQEQFPRGVLRIPKIEHSGGSDDAPNALPNLLAAAEQQLELRAIAENKLISAADPALFDYPIVFLHGRRDFQLSAAEKQALATFVERGGVIFADAICASPQFAEAFRREMQDAFGRRLERIPTTHAMFGSEFQGFNLDTVSLRDPQARAGENEPLETRIKRITPLLEGIQIDDRYGVIFSPYDLSCALEKHASLDCKGYIKQDAARIGLNVILYALQQ